MAAFERIMPSFDDISGCVSADYVVPSAAKPLVDYTIDDMPTLEQGELAQSLPFREMQSPPPEADDGGVEADNEAEEAEGEGEAEEEEEAEEEAEEEEAEPIIEEHDIEKNPFEVYQKFNTCIFMWVLCTGVMTGYLLGKLFV
jgi:hypothetical protein